MCVIASLAELANACLSKRFTKWHVSPLRMRVESGENGCVGSSLKPLHKRTVGEDIWPITARHLGAYMPCDAKGKIMFIWGQIYEPSIQNSSAMPITLK